MGNFRKKENPRRDMQREHTQDKREKGMSDLNLWLHKCEKSSHSTEIDAGKRRHATNAKEKEILIFFVEAEMIVGLIFSEEQENSGHLVYSCHTAKNVMTFFVYELKNTIYQNIDTKNIKAKLKLTINIYIVPFQ
jgi:hypothetical protein